MGAPNSATGPPRLGPQVLALVFIYQTLQPILGLAILDTRTQLAPAWFPRVGGEPFAAREVWQRRDRAGHVRHATHPGASARKCGLGAFVEVQVQQICRIHCTQHIYILICRIGQNIWRDPTLCLCAQQTPSCTEYPCFPFGRANTGG